MQVVIQPLPRNNLSNIQARLSICQGRKEQETPDEHGQNDAAGSPGIEEALPADPLADRATTLLLGLEVALAAFLDLLLGEVGDLGGLDVEDEFDDGAGDEGGGEVRGQVVVQEELAAHDEEGEVVGGPDQEEETCAVVEARAGS